MPTVKSEVLIPNVTLGVVWNAVSAFELYPETMENVTSVKFHERDERFGISEWRVTLNGTELTWTERDAFEPQRRIYFESIDGDIETLRGEWLLKEHGNGVLVSLETEFDLGIPSLAAVLDPVSSEALQTNSRSMLMAIKNQVS